MMKTKIGLLFVMLAASLIAGTGCEEVRDPVGKDTAPSPRSIPAVERLALIEGTFEGGRELGDPAGYTLRLRAKDNSLGFIRIRREAIWTQEDMSNVLGTVPCGTMMWARGPLKNADYSMGVGYAVAIQDSHGRQRRGYVSATVVDVVQEQESQ